MNGDHIHFIYHMILECKFSGNGQYITFGYIEHIVIMTTSNGGLPDDFPDN